MNEAVRAASNFSRLGSSLETQADVRSTFERVPTCFLSVRRLIWREFILVEVRLGEGKVGCVGVVFNVLPVSLACLIVVTVVLVAGLTQDLLNFHEVISGPFQLGPFLKPKSPLVAQCTMRHFLLSIGSIKGAVSWKLG